MTEDTFQQGLGSDDTVREWTPGGQVIDQWDERVRGFQDGIPHMAWTVRNDGSIEYVNRRWREYTGMSAEEMADWKWTTIIHPEDKERFMAHWRKAMSSGEHFESELRIRRHDGVYRWHSLKDWPAREEDGTIIRWFGTATDIQEQRELAEKLQASNRELTQFASMAAHDLQEPLRMVGSFVSLLNQKYAGAMDERAQQYVAHAINGSERMRLLIVELLEYSRVGHAAAPMAEVETAEVLDEVQRNLKTVVEDTDFTITHGALPSVHMNRSHLLSLLQNLIGNGLKYHRPSVPPAIHVEVSRQAAAWIFSISDNGIGIKAEDRSRIFEAFTRLHTRDEFAGTGIGLAICKKIVDRYQGCIWVEPSKSGGSTFRFSIPDARSPDQDGASDAR